MAFSRLQAKHNHEWQFCHEILPSVSRTFALTIPVLPEPLSDSVCGAYLLCRVADTIEDRGGLQPSRRARLYRLLSQMVAGPARPEMLEQFRRSWPRTPAAPYQHLIDGLPEVLAAFVSLPPEHRDAINVCVQDMIGGMQSMSHPPAVGRVMVVSQDLEELERYCHYVAGTVGVMLTRLFRIHLGPAALRGPEQEERGRRFGIGLQLTNILKDYMDDLARGTSFVPASWWKGLDPHQGLEAAAKARLIQRALGHLDEAQEYTLSIPAEAQGIRLFCLWAMWMAVATLREVASSAERIPKIGRPEVTAITSYAREHVDDDEALRRRYLELRQAAWDRSLSLVPG